MKRYGSIIGVKPEKLDEYKRLHAAAWPGVLRMIHDCHIRNYSIYFRRMPDGAHYLFSYFECWKNCILLVIFIKLAVNFIETIKYDFLSR